jgi:hypothetical protein
MALICSFDDVLIVTVSATFKMSRSGLAKEKRLDLRRELVYFLYRG